MNKEEQLADILLKAHQKYVDWWLPIDVAGGSFLAPMGLYIFCGFMLKLPDEEFFDRWVDDNELPIPKDGDIREARINMKDYILKCIGMHLLGHIDLHDKGNEFKWINQKHPQMEELIKKWEKTGLLDDIDGILENTDLVKLMESKASQLLREENQNQNNNE